MLAAGSDGETVVIGGEYADIRSTTRFANTANDKAVMRFNGAGDSFAGGFLGSLARAGSLDAEALRQALAWGTVTASFTVQRFSVRGLTELEPEALDARYAELREQVRV